jgi:site-specific DNA-methyltransferase (adenine-specific)
MVNVVHNMDCMIGMSEYPDKYFDLAVVDPPYGIGEDGKKNHSRGKLAKAKQFIEKNWDRIIPDKFYFEELLRVSKNQIIWGGNYYGLPASSCWLVWDKLNGGTDFADCELAWTSFTSAVRKFTYRWAGMLQGDMKNKEWRIHPTQKPVKLYDWILTHYAKPGMSILDTHVGSGSSRIAADKHGLDFIGYELDLDYWTAQEKRYAEYKSQMTLW